MNTNITSGPWFTDGLVVWAHSAGGPAICAARNLNASEGTIAPVEDLDEQRANMQAIAALPALIEALQDLLRTNDQLFSFIGSIQEPPLAGAYARAITQGQAVLDLLAKPLPPP